MTTKLISFWLIMFSMSLMAQVQFEKGFIITDGNNRIECLIRNPDWLNMPKSIQYKTHDNPSEVLTISVQDMRAFQIYDTRHYYKKLTFMVDNNRERKTFIKERVTDFVKVIVEGKVSLLEFKDSFLYQIEEGTATSLDYKRYANEFNKIIEDKTFRVQLFENFKCDANVSQIRKVRYSRGSLADFFTRYNTCIGSDSKTFGNKRSLFKYHLSVKAGTHQYTEQFPVKASFVVPPSAGFESPIYTRNLKNKGSNFNAGFDFRISLPFHKNKWSIFVNPTYQTYKGESFTATFRNLTAQITTNDFSYIEIPFGATHDVYLSKKAKLSLSLAFNYLILQSEPVVSFYDDPTDNGPVFLPLQFVPQRIKSENSSYRVSTAFSYGRYEFDIHFYPKKHFAGKNHEVSLDNAVGFTLGYRIF